MATSYQLQIKGLNELKDKLNRFPRTASKHLAEAINQSVLAVEAKARPLTPVKTGILVNSYASGRVKATPRRLAGMVKPTAHYAEEVSARRDVGERYINPSKNKKAVGGFVIVGAQQAEDKVNTIFDKAIDNIVKEITG